ncbi:hypothetical protein AbraIFM66951_003628 [Aspergillus brasiliensis]|uniref:Zn(2)-C6 fungal-type domain-containing protein n=1 Tax=Aspergillus brasiliensis TaxID=319629 RepID=A0A9W6DRP5_9EURO|nr:hypothetical protein AbraCBS73388_002565 [Aspergillus brasiliensis]GKZ50491.1 hypothetical protein AbraIFM66951_003628 [Aspergillus brasiliensis]
MTAESETMATRRKLRVTTGCQTCRARRVKCDETKPSCKNCGKKNRRCVYDNKAPSRSRTRAARRRARSPSDPVSPPAPVHSQVEDGPSQVHAQSASPRVSDGQNAEVVSSFDRPSFSEGVGPRPIRDQPAPEVALRGPSTDGEMYQSSQQIQDSINLASILWPREESNPDLPSIDWNHSSLPALTDPQFDELDDFPTAGESPIGTSFYVTDHQLPLSTSEILIFRNYVDTVSRWIDSFSWDQPFYSVVPMLALRCPVLMNSCLALSAKHLALKAPANETALRANIAVKYHQRAIRGISKLITDPACAWNDSILASSVILSTYEMLDVAGDSSGAHLRGVAYFLQSRGVYGDASGIKGAVYWTWYRHEIWAALQTGEPMFLDEQYWKPEDIDSFENLCVEEIANRAIFIFGQCVSFCNDKSTPEGVTADERRRNREHRAESLRHALEDWKQKLSTSSANFMSETPPPTETSTYEFPFLWFVYPQSAIAYQVYHASKILLNLNSYPPVSEAFIIGSRQSLSHRREIERSREQILLVSNSGIPDTCSLVSTQCLYIAGMVTEGLLERRLTLKLIEDCQKRSGRKTCTLADALRKLWSE